MAEIHEKLTTPVFELTVRLGEDIDPFRLVHARSGRLYADAGYRYVLTVKDGEEKRGLKYRRHERARLVDGSECLTLIGVIAGVEVEHVFETCSDASCLKETTAFTNTTEKTIEVERLSLGFRKRLEGLSDRFHLVAVPYRIQVDGKVHDYPLERLLNHEIQNSERTPPWLASQKTWDGDTGRSEGWALTDEREGLLAVKYNQDMMEYSMAGVDEESHLFFGGVGLCLYGEPDGIRILKPGHRATAGTTRYFFMEGGWREGYKTFKTFMNGKGHRFPENFNPPVHWNELFDVGWYHSDREQLFKHYTREALFYECRKAAELGCEQLYLDPGWEICEGTTL